MTMLDVHDTASRVRPALVPERSANDIFSAANSGDLRRIRALMADRVAKAISAMISETITITPAMAEYLLANHNHGNRTISQSRAQKYANQMKAGAFKLTAQGISFDPSGNLNNGQHRLTGVVLSGIPVRMYVTFGEDRSAFSVLDTGGARTGGDVLSIMGYGNANALSAAARLLDVIENGLVSKRKFGVTNDEIISFVESHKELPNAVAASLRVAKKFCCSSSGVACAFYLITMKARKRDILPKFVDALMDGSGLEKNSPILKLRDGLQSRTISTGVIDSGTGRVVLAATIVMAWNKWSKGRTGGISWNTSSPFPSVE